MIDFKKVNFEELKHMDLDVAREIAKQFRGAWLENAGCSFNNKIYEARFLDESDWDVQGKYQYRKEYGLLCNVDKDGKIIEEYDICVINNITRYESYFSYYGYENDFRVERIIKKTIPEVVIPEHTVITLAE